MNYIRQLRLDRRTLLRGARGVALALPFLDAMMPAGASAETAAKAAPPKRLGFILYPHGVIPDQWMPKEVGPNYKLTAPMEPLAPNRDRFSVLTGLACDPSKTRQGFHDRALASIFTGVEMSKKELRVAPSVDQIAARTLGQETAFGSLELAGEQMNFFGAGIYKTATQALPLESNPRLLFERLFGDAERIDPEALAAMRVRQQSMLDLLSSDVHSVRRNLGAADKRKLAEYLDAVRDIERRLEFTEKLAKQDVGYDRPAGSPQSYSERVRMMFDLMIIGWQTDMTRVASFMMNAEVSNATFPEIDWGYSYHMTSHHNFDPKIMEGITRINKYHATQFNYLLTKMGQIDEGNGTLLDNTMVFYGSNFGDANNHMQVDLPVMLAGGAAAGIKGGRHVSYPTDTPITNLWLTMLNKAGVPIEQIGDSTGMLDV